MDRIEGPGEVVVDVSAGRRGIAVGMMIVLGLLLLYLAAVVPPAAAIHLGVLILAGLAALAQALRLYLATAQGLSYVGGVLREAGEGGRVIARLEDVASVDRGAFAFKPSNGFLLTLQRDAPGSVSWAPGVWWRIGRRVGVGGVVRAGSARALAEVISMQVASRDRP